MKFSARSWAAALVLAASALLLTAGLALAADATLRSTRPPAIQSGAAVLMDVDTGTVLFQKGMHEPRAVASTTKIMTALLALESANLDERVAVGPAATQVSGSALGLNPGDLMRMDDLLAALLVVSANDAAVAIAEHISGSVPAFCARMNERARELGATHTHFVNPHGLYDPNHYASAYDLALITREALTHPRFRELVSAKVADINLPSAPGGAVQLTNHNKLLWRADFVDGVKTGYVNESGKCLVASGTKDGWQLVAVVLDSPDTYAEALSLLEYGFSTYQRTVYAKPGDALGQAPVCGGAQRSVPAVCQRTVAAVTGPGLPGEATLDVTLRRLRAPVAKNDPVGEVRLLAEDTVLLQLPLLAGQQVPRSAFALITLWTLRTLILVLIVTLLVRTYAKAAKANRSRRSGLSPQSD